MSVPRQILPGRFYKITRRCTQRQFLLRPDDETNNAFVYCLAEAAARFEIEIIASSAQSNHHHCDVFDRHGRVVEFMEHFHKMMAKCMNAFRGRCPRVHYGVFTRVGVRSGAEAGVGHWVGSDRAG